MSWKDLARQVRVLGTQLRKLGVQAGDRVVAYMPNIVETVVAMLATTAVGGVWSSAAPEFGVQAVDRFRQITPKLMFAADGYRYGGKDFDRSGQIAEIARAVESIETIVWLDYLGSDPPPPGLTQRLVPWGLLLDDPPVETDDFQFEHVGSDHPLWILFSSGTTGLPKPIVHGHVGILLEHYKGAPSTLIFALVDACFFIPRLDG